MPLFLPTPRGTDAAKSSTQNAKSSTQNRHFHMQRTTVSQPTILHNCCCATDRSISLSDTRSRRIDSAPHQKPRRTVILLRPSSNNGPPSPSGKVIEISAEV